MNKKKYYIITLKTPAALQWKISVLLFKKCPNLQWEQNKSAAFLKQLQLYIKNWTKQHHF